MHLCNTDCLQTYKLVTAVSIKVRGSSAVDIVLAFRWSLIWIYFTIRWSIIGNGLTGRWSLFWINFAVRWSIIGNSLAVIRAIISPSNRFAGHKSDHLPVKTFPMIDHLTAKLFPMIDHLTVKPFPMIDHLTAEKFRRAIIWPPKRCRLLSKMEKLLLKILPYK